MECFTRSFASVFRCGDSCNVTNHFGVVAGDSGHDAPEYPIVLDACFAVAGAVVDNA